MKKHITLLNSITMLALANFVYCNATYANTIGGNNGFCVQTLNSTSPEGVGGQVKNCTLNWPWWTCTGSCSGYQPPVGTVCDTCNKVLGTESRFSNCVDGTIPQTGTKVTSSCEGWYECGCANNWTPVAPPASGAFYCNASGDPC